MSGLPGGALPAPAPAGRARPRRMPGLALAAALLAVAVPGSATAGSALHPAARAPLARTQRADPAPAVGRFLVANRQLPDPRFAQTVVLLIRYGADGAMGLVVNRPTRVRLSEAFPELEGLERRSDVVHLGGPVAVHQMLVLLRTGDPPQEAQPVLDDVYASPSRSLLERLLAEPREGEVFRVFAGYAGWGPRQLDGEIARGDWLVTEGDAVTLFDEAPGRIWRLLILRGAGKAVQLLPPRPAWRRLGRWSPAAP